MKLSQSQLRKIISEEVKAVLKENFESEFEDMFSLDQSAGGVDNSMNRIHRALLKLQTQMNELMLAWKNGDMSTEEYIAKRKPFQDKRNQLERSLF